jgi:hypothetical protein
LDIADEKANEVRNGVLSVEAALAVAVAELLDNVVALFERGSAGSSRFLAGTTLKYTVRSRLSPSVVIVVTDSSIGSGFRHPH